MKFEPLAKMALELFGASVSKFANKFTSYSIDSSLIIDMTAKPDDRQFWDLGTREDQERLGTNAARTPNRTLDWKRAMHILSHSYCTRSEKGTKEQIENVQDEERRLHPSAHQSVQERVEHG